MSKLEKFLNEIPQIETFIKDSITIDGDDVGIHGYTLAPLILDYLNNKQNTFEHKLLSLHSKRSLDEFNYSTLNQKLASNYENFKEFPESESSYNSKIANYSYSYFELPESKSFHCAWDYFIQDMNYNCFQVAYCISNERIYYTKEFLNFLDTLVVNRVKNNILLKDLIYLNELKKSYNEVKLNLSLELKTLSTYFLINNRLDTLSTGISFSTKTPYSHIHLDNTDAALLLDRRRDFLPYFNINYKQEIFVIIGHNDTSPFMYLCQQEADIKHLVDEKSLKFINFAQKGNTKRQERLCSILSSAILPSKFYSGVENKKIIEESLKDDFNEEKIIKLHDFMVNHERLRIQAGRLVKKGWKIYHIATFIKKIEKEKYNSIIGYIENYEVDKLSVPKDYKEARDIAKFLIKEYWDERKKNERKLVKAINLNNFKEKAAIKELTTNIELELEGEYMNHCVGGYSNSIGEAHRIFHLKTDSDESTLELKKRQRKWCNMQHRGKCNAKPSIENNKLACDLVDFLNQEVLDKDASEFQKAKAHYTKMSKQNDFINTYTEEEMIVINKLINSNNIVSFIKEINQREDLTTINLYILQNTPKTINILKNGIQCVAPNGCYRFWKFIADVKNENKKIFVLLENTHFKNRDDYKARGYSWDPQLSSWWTYANINEISNDEYMFRDHNPRPQMKFYSFYDKKITKIIDRCEEYGKEVGGRHWMNRAQTTRIHSLFNGDSSYKDILRKEEEALKSA